MIAEEIARGDSGLADKLVQIWKVSVLLRNIAPRHLQERWFPRIVEDPHFLLAHCLTEPRGASDRWLPYDVPEAAMQTRAVKQGDEWVINGRKQFITNGYDAGLFVVYANTNPKVGMLQGTSSFLVPRDTPGLTVARCNETLGCRFMNNGELVFEDMRVPEDHLLAEDDAMANAGIYFKPGKIIQAAKNLGVGVRAFEVTSDYVQNYVQGGRILIKHQAVAMRLADMATKLAAVRALLERAAAAVDANAPDADALCNMAKLFASEEILKVATARGRAARRQRHDARFRRREALPRCGDLPAHGRHRRHLTFQDREGDVPGDRREICRAGGVSGQRRQWPHLGGPHLAMAMRKEKVSTRGPLKKKTPGGSRCFGPAGHCRGLPRLLCLSLRCNPRRPRSRRSYPDRAVRIVIPFAPAGPTI